MSCTLAEKRMHAYGIIRLHRRSRRRCHGPRPVPAVRGPLSLRGPVPPGPVLALKVLQPGWFAAGAGEQATDTRTSCVSRPVPAAREAHILNLRITRWDMPPFNGSRGSVRLNGQLQQCRGTNNTGFACRVRICSLRATCPRKCVPRCFRQRCRGEQLGIARTRVGEMAQNHLLNSNCSGW